MKKFIATLFALMLVAAIMPAALARDGDRGIRLDSSVELDSDDDSTEIESEVELESEDGSDDGSDDSSDDNSSDSDDSETELEYESETEVEGNKTKESFRAEIKDGMLRVRSEYQDGAVRLRQEFRQSGFSNLTVEERKELLSSLQERRKELVEDRQAAMAEIRAEIKVETTRIKELREEYKGERDDFIKARDELKVKCENTRSDDCVKAKQKLNVEAEGFMGNAAEQMLRIIETTKVRIEANENIDNETAVAVIAQLDARASRIEQAQTEIDALSNSTDLNATKQAAADLRAAWAEARVTIRLSEGLLNHARYADFLDQLSLMEARFTEARDKLAAEGKDVTQLDADIASFSAKIDAAAETYAQGQDSYLGAMATAKTEADANALLKSTRDQLKDGHDQLQDARNDLRSIIKDIRVLSSDVLRETAEKIQDDAQATASVEVSE